MKSIGLAIVLLLAQSAAFAKATNTATSGGRFQLMQLSDMRRDKFLLDTQTGKIWTLKCFVSGADDASCTYSAWTLDDVQDVNANINEIIKAAESFEKKQQK